MHSYPSSPCLAGLADIYSIWLRCFPVVFRYYDNYELGPSLQWREGERPEEGWDEVKTKRFTATRLKQKAKPLITPSVLKFYFSNQSHNHHKDH